jgi:hypothetical protein
MPQDDPNSYAGLTTEQLEEKLKQSSLSSSERDLDLIEEELTNRYTESLFLLNTQRASTRRQSTVSGGEKGQNFLSRFTRLFRARQ